MVIFSNNNIKVGGASLKAEFADIVNSCNQWNVYIIAGSLWNRYIIIYISKIQINYIIKFIYLNNIIHLYWLIFLLNTYLKKLIFIFDK